MRKLTLIATVVSSCSPMQPETAGIAEGIYAGAGRNAMCIANRSESRRSGFVVYGGGDANCTVQGKIEKLESGWILVPNGEGSCRIPLSVADQNISLGDGGAACDYYCGPKVSFAGTEFRKSAGGDHVVDLVGDKLC